MWKYSTKSDKNTSGCTRPGRYIIISILLLLSSTQRCNLLINHIKPHPYWKLPKRRLNMVSEANKLLPLTWSPCYLLGIWAFFHIHLKDKKFERFQIWMFAVTDYRISVSVSAVTVSPVRVHCHDMILLTCIYSLHDWSTEVNKP